MHCVAPSLAAFDDLRVAATLYSGVSEGGADSEPVMVAEPAAIKTDVWMAADTAGLADRAAAGYGGSAKVLTSRLDTPPAESCYKMLSCDAPAPFGHLLNVPDRTDMLGSAPGSFKGAARLVDALQVSRFSFVRCLQSE